MTGAHGELVEVVDERGDVERLATARVFHVVHDGPFRPADGEVAELVQVPLARLDAWLAGRDLCPDSAALVVPRLSDLARGDAPRPPPGTGG